jgi:IS5 family transposase
LWSSQNYNRISKHLVKQQSRYAHARQLKRAQGCTRKLKTYLGRVIRDIERKQPNLDDQLRSLLETAQRILTRQPLDKQKVYSVHEPLVECISKGKAHKRYEFGCKVSVAATSRGGWFVGAKAIHGNPYDGHTLTEALSQVERIAGATEHVFVDMGYRGHGYEGDRINAILCAAGMNFKKLQRFAAAFLRHLLMPFFGGFHSFVYRFGCQRANA